MSYLFSDNTAYIEVLYEEYLENSETISGDWKQYFDQLQDFSEKNHKKPIPDKIYKPIIESQQLNKNLTKKYKDKKDSNLSIEFKQVCIQSLISAYRSFGILWADLDPLNRQEKIDIPELEPSFYGLTEFDLDQEYTIPDTYSKILTS